MSRLTISFLMVVLISFWGCDQHEEHDQHDEHEHSQQSTSDEQPEVTQHTKAADHNFKKELSQENRNELKLLFEVNERLHSAFFEYAPEKVESIAKEMIVSIESLNEPEISKRLHYSKETLAKIKASADREENNQNYHLVSMALIHLLNNFEIDDKYRGFTCPMIKMQWVQNTAELERVHNPFAPQMPHCGEAQY